MMGEDKDTISKQEVWRSLALSLFITQKKVIPFHSMKLQP
jgi:hypothetical protein